MYIYIYMCVCVSFSTYSALDETNRTGCGMIFTKRLPHNLYCSRNFLWAQGVKRMGMGKDTRLLFAGILLYLMNGRRGRKKLVYHNMSARL